MKTKICPYVNACPIYQIWVEQSRDEEIDVIRDNGVNYSCIALEILKEIVSEEGNAYGEELKKRLEKEEIEISECSHISLLNRLGG